MKNLNLFYYGSQDFIREIGKKGTQSDITLYSRKTDDYVFTILNPSLFPDKLSSLTDCIAPVDAAILQVETIDKNLGEVIMALDLSGISTGLVYTSEENADRIKSILSNTSLKNYPVLTDNGASVVEKAGRFDHRTQGRGTKILIDHFFTVRSVGTVALGFVTSGKVEKHQDLFLSLAKKSIQVRSIQVQDEDVPEAEEGTRVGLSLKGIDTDELERGMVLSDTEIDSEKLLKGSIAKHPAQKNPPPDQGEVFFASTMRYQRGTMEKGDISLDSPIYMLDGKGVICSQSLTPRIIASFNSSKSP